MRSRRATPTPARERQLVPNPEIGTTSTRLVPGPGIGTSYYEGYVVTSAASAQDSLGTFKDYVVGSLLGPRLASAEMRYGRRRPFHVVFSRPTGEAIPPLRLVPPPGDTDRLKTQPLEGGTYEETSMAPNPLLAAQRGGAHGG